MKKILFLIGLSITIFNIQVNGCTIIAVGKKASADGSNIISHTDKIGRASCRERVYSNV